MNPYLQHRVVILGHGEVGSWVALALRRAPVHLTWIYPAGAGPTSGSAMIQQLNTHAAPLMQIMVAHVAAIEPRLRHLIVSEAGHARRQTQRSVVYDTLIVTEGAPALPLYHNAVVHADGSIDASTDIFVARGASTSRAASQQGQAIARAMMRRLAGSPPRRPTLRPGLWPGLWQRLGGYTTA